MQVIQNSEHLQHYLSCRHFRANGYSERVNIPSFWDLQTATIKPGKQQVNLVTGKQSFLLIRSVHQRMHLPYRQVDFFLISIDQTTMSTVSKALKKLSVCEWWYYWQEGTVCHQYMNVCVNGLMWQTCLENGFRYEYLLRILQLTCKLVYPCFPT